jgi:hypothetical protein
MFDANQKRKVFEEFFKRANDANLLCEKNYLAQGKAAKGFFCFFVCQFLFEQGRGNFEGMKKKIFSFHPLSIRICWSFVRFLF